MSARFKFFELGLTHDDVALDIIRSFLGVALFVRGVIFIGDASRILDLVQAEQVGYLLPALALQVTAGLHLGGGLMLATGLLTRWGALAQLPVLLAATYVVTIRGGLFMPNQSLELTVLVLFLLVILAIFGSGPLSLDNILFGEAKLPAPLPPSQMPHRIRERERKLRRAEEDAAAAEAHEDEVELPQWRSEAKVQAEGNIWRVGMLLKYGSVAVVAAILLILLVRALPFEVSPGEIGAVVGALFLILGFFFAFFGWALRE